MKKQSPENLSMNPKKNFDGNLSFTVKPFHQSFLYDVTEKTQMSLDEVFKSNGWSFLKINFLDTETHSKKGTAVRATGRTKSKSKNPLFATHYYKVVGKKGLSTIGYLHVYFANGVLKDIHIKAKSTVEAIEAARIFSSEFALSQYGTPDSMDLNRA